MNLPPPATIQAKAFTKRFSTETTGGKIAVMLLSGEPNLQIKQMDGGAFLVKAYDETSECQWRGVFMPLGPYENEDIPDWITQ